MKLGSASALLIALVCSSLPAARAQDSVVPIADGSTLLRPVAQIDPTGIDESSGIVHHGGAYYTHNDSGGDPVVFRAETPDFKDAARLEVPGATNVDWEDIATLAHHFLDGANAKMGREIKGFTNAAVDRLMSYEWTGNVRELENMVKRVLVLGSEESVRNELAEKNAGGGIGGYGALIELIERAERTAGEVPLREVGRLAAQEAERETIGRVLHHTDWNRKQAARLLGISYKTLLQKIRGCGLEPV